MSRTIKPAKLLPINITNIAAAPQSFTPSSTNDWPNNTDQWDVTMNVTQMPHSAMHVGNTPGYWGGLDVNVGDWITSQGSGRSLQIVSITSRTASKVVCRCRDKYRVNTFNDQGQNGDGGIQRGKGFLYEVKNAMPVLYPLPDAFPGTISSMMAAQLITRAFHDGGETGFNPNTSGIQADTDVSLVQPLGGGGGGGVSQFTKLTDVPSSYGSNSGYLVRINSNATGLEFVAPPATPSFIKLSDAPASYSGQAGQFIRVNSRATALEFVNPPSGGPGGGGSDKIQTPTTGAYNDGAIKGWVPNTTTLADAFYQTNKFLNYFVPVSPPDLSNITMLATDALYSRNSHNLLTATGIPSRCGYQLSFGTHVPFTGNQTITIKAKAFGYNQTGSLVAKLNGQIIGEIDHLELGSNGGLSDHSLKIDADYIFPVGDPISTYKALDVTILVSGYDVGINEVTLTCATGTSLINFIYDNDSTISTMTNTKVVVNNYGTLYYSSGVPHLTSSSNLTVSTNLSGWCSYGFVDGDILTMQYNPLLAPEEDIGQGMNNIPATFGVSAPDVSVKNIVVDLSATMFGIVALLFRTSKPLVDSTWVQKGPKLLIANGTPATAIIESGWIRNNITLKRALVASSLSLPDMSYLQHAQDLTWDSGNVNSVGSSHYTYLASVIGGAVMASQDDYSNNYEPINGPDLSGKGTKQFFDFYFQASISEFTITVVGDQPDTIMICLPNIKNSYGFDPTNFQGWFNGRTYFDFPQGTWPGYYGSGVGCLYHQDNSNSYTFTFGRLSSKDSLEQIILVRFSLSAGKVINDIIVQ